ncbi:MAG: hypothetical protein WC858_04415 [Parcubacteria group bacterium]|jgi:orotidine-5'-phosphate decarboxylase
MPDHAFLELIDAQTRGGTLYCGGYDLHPQQDVQRGAWDANMAVYGFQNGGQIAYKTERYDFYNRVVALEGLKGTARERYAGLLAAIEDYLCYVAEISVLKCGLFVFKTQWGFYVQFGPAGAFLLQRLRRKFQELEATTGCRIIVILDCKPGDIATTQAAYFTGFMGSLMEQWGIDHAPFDFDVINPAPWMGRDVLVLEEKGRLGLGLKLLRQGKCLIYVNKTSNPSGPEYQDLLVKAGNEEMALFMLNALHAHQMSEEYGLHHEEVSQFGLVVGATRTCDGSIRRMFPWYTGLHPGFGAQSLGKDPLSPFRKVILELRRDGRWNGFGGVHSSSRNHLFAWQKQYGGSGQVENLEQDLVAAVRKHRTLEEEAFNLPEVIDAGIDYPFS